MTPNDKFLHQRKQFWAYVRSISQKVGYTLRKTAQIKVPTVEQMAKALKALGLDPTRVIDKDGTATDLGKTLFEYFQYRADVLNTFVQPRLMNVERARELFGQLQAGSKYKWPVPMNKQKGEKKAPAYLTAIINMLIETNAEDLSCDLDPLALTTVTFDGSPLRTLARRVDGAFPSAVWEIKEYYYTTTFGSRVADGVYETLLDGMELEELRINEGVSVLHYLMVDDHFTWWVKGRSYLCRIIDMLHMGYVDEVLFGSEVAERIPTIVQGWVELARKNPIAVT